MPMGHFKLGLVTAFAVLFGVVQLICACMPVAQSDHSMPAQVSVVHQMGDLQSHDMAAHTGHHMTTPSSSAHDHDENNHQADCAHCDDTVVLAVITDVAPSIYTTPVQYKTVFTIPSQAARNGTVDTQFTALNWRDPPRPLSHPNPVTFKTRSLT